MSSYLKRLLALHLMASVLMAGCILCANLKSEFALFWPLAGLLLAVVLGTLKDLFEECRECILRNG
mgnify:CR=1 FL=1